MENGRCSMPGKSSAKRFLRNSCRSALLPRADLEGEAQHRTRTRPGFLQSLLGLKGLASYRGHLHQRDVSARLGHEASSCRSAPCNLSPLSPPRPSPLLLTILHLLLSWCTPRQAQPLCVLRSPRLPSAESHEGARYPVSVRTSPG